MAAQTNKVPPARSIVIQPGVRAERLLTQSRNTYCSTVAGGTFHELAPERRWRRAAPFDSVRYRAPTSATREGKLNRREVEGSRSAAGGAPVVGPARGLERSTQTFPQRPSGARNNAGCSAHVVTGPLVTAGVGIGRAAHSVPTEKGTARTGLLKSRWSVGLARELTERNNRNSRIALTHSRCRRSRVGPAQLCRTSPNGLSVGLAWIGGQ